MGKQTKRSYEEKEMVVKEALNGVSYSVLCKKYNISHQGTIANWKRKYLEGALQDKQRGRKAIDIDDYEILKKSYALLMEIRSKQNK